MPFWYFDKSELKNTPSFRDGIEADQESRYRREGARFLMECGINMGLRHETMATGVVFYHRFYMFHSFNEFPRYVMATCSLFLAGKVEETPKKCKDIVKAAKVWLEGKNLKSYADKFTDESIKDIMVHERILLKTLKFDLQVDHPYGYLLKYAKTLKGNQEQIRSMVQMAWTFINDSFCTTLCLQWEPEITAIALMYLTSKLSKLEVTDWNLKTENKHLNWWDQFVDGLRIDILEDICHQILDLYATQQANKDKGAIPGTSTNSPNNTTTPTTPNKSTINTINSENTPTIKKPVTPSSSNPSLSQEQSTKDPVHPQSPSVHPQSPSVHPQAPSVHPQAPSVHPQAPSETRNSQFSSNNYPNNYENNPEAGGVPPGFNNHQNSHFYPHAPHHSGMYPPMNMEHFHQGNSHFNMNNSYDNNPHHNPYLNANGMPYYQQQPNFQQNLPPPPPPPIDNYNYPPTSNNNPYANRGGGHFDQYNNNNGSNNGNNGYNAYANQSAPIRTPPPPQMQVFNGISQNNNSNTNT